MSGSIRIVKCDVPKVGKHATRRYMPCHEGIGVSSFAPRATVAYKLPT